MSSELAAKIRVGLEELAIVRQQFESLLPIAQSADLGVIETSAACAMLHSFYTEIEKILKIIARDWDQSLPASESWHRDLLAQMSQATETRPAVLSSELLATLKEFLAFRHLFRGASIALMRWNKLYPLVNKVDQTYVQVETELRDFVAFIEAP
ncbi:hypothetical protein F183_A06400 [Bryobacterales bacterium F-183]|nr:hypothetical protein F183_A06400 [Bryobacterales bacterium F-183]